MNRMVADIMTREVITVSEEDNLAHLAHGMEEFGVRHLPVVSGKRLVGLISHRDLLRLSVGTLSPTAGARAADERAKENTFAASVMTRQVLTVRPDTLLLQAARLMVANKVGCLPVVDENGELVGIVSEHDLLKELARGLQSEAEEEAGLRKPSRA
jgi:CBS domain-containing protein